MSDVIDVIYLDNHLLVVNKPASIPTQSSKLHTFAMQEACKDYLKEKFNKPGNVFCEPIHRLDKDVSGLIVFARTSKALSRLNKQMKEKSINKTYLAIVEGHIEKDKGHLIHYLEKRNYYTEVFDAPNEKAKKAELTFEKISFENGCTRLKVHLLTGRYHQIRAQLSKIGHPILGDKKYRSSQDGLGSISLHHKEVSFFHPTTNERLTFHSKESL